MNYKVCIMAAGKGTRVSYAKNFNKAILPVGEKSSLSRIIDKFPVEVEIVIAIGYNANLVREFVEVAYRHRKVTLVEVDNYDGPGSGPGYSLKYCSPHLQCPFIFTSADTITLESVPEPDKNWVGVAKARNPEACCLVGAYNGLVKEYFNKMTMGELLKRCRDPQSAMDNAFIGMAGVYDYQDFWAGFEKNSAVDKGELQVMNGLENIINKNTHIVPFTWFDTGNDTDYYFSNKYFSELNLLLKPDEFLYFENGNVIKYFSDKQILADRVKRADMLKGIVPEITYHNENFYTYEYVQGVTLNKINRKDIFEKLLAFCQENLWQPMDLALADQKDFQAACVDFYVEKTKKRIEMFYAETGITDSEEKINGTSVPKLSTLLEQIDWDYLCQGVPVLFHGDLQPENIIVQEDGFKLIDWRHDFGGLHFGDLYYDLAKMYHALIISNEVIRDGNYEIQQEENEIKLDYLIKNNLLEFLGLLENFIIAKGYDLNKVKILTALIYLNIAPLNSYPYNIFLYYLGKSMLFKTLSDSNIGSDRAATDSLVGLYLNEQVSIANNFPIETVAKLVEMVKEAYDNDRTIYLCGNGGNAAFASNFATDLLFHPFVTDDKSDSAVKDAKRIKVVDLTGSAATLTGLLNDFGSDYIFSQQLVGQIQSGDLLIGFSGSGNSANILKAFEIAKAAGVKTAGITRGNGGKIKETADLCLIIPGTSNFPGQVGKNNNNFHFEDYLGSIAHIVTGIMQKYVREKYGQQ